MIFRSDCEPSIQALLRALSHHWFGEVVLQTTPEGDPASNGPAECVGGLVKNLLRTTKDALEDRLKVPIPETHFILDWALAYTTSVHRRHVIGRDGKTSSERVHGKSSQ